MALDTSRVTQIGPAITLPFFNTPYTYPDPINTGAGLLMSAGSGDFAGVGNGKTSNNSNPNSQIGVGCGTIDMFTLTALQRMTFNGGVNNPNYSGVTNKMQPGILCDGQWYWPDMDGFTTTLNQWYSQGRVGSIPFQNGKNLSQAPTDATNSVVDLNLSGNNIYTMSSDGGSTQSAMGRLCVKVTALIGFTTVDLGVNLKGLVTHSTQNLNRGISAFYPPMGAFIQLIDPNSSDLFLFSSNWSIPDYKNRTTYFWYFKFDGTFAYRRVDASVDILSKALTVNPSGTIYKFATNNAAFNSALAASQVQMYNVANGMIVADLQNHNDYFLSADGAFMYPLVYVNYGTVPATPFNATAQPYRLVIDVTGIAYFTGNSAVTGTTLQPLFSLGFNIPFNPVILPQIPPIPFPCWDPCLGRVGGAPGQLNMSNTQNN